MWNPWKTHWALALVKGITEPHEVKKKFFWPRWESNPRPPDYIYRYSADWATRSDRESRGRLRWWIAAKSYVQRQDDVMVKNSIAGNRLHILPRRTPATLLFFSGKTIKAERMLLISLQVLEFFNHGARSKTIINCFSLNHSLRPWLKINSPYETCNDCKVWSWLLEHVEKRFS